MMQLCGIYDIVRATIEFDRVVVVCGLTVSVLKIKLLVVGTQITQDNLGLISITGDSVIEMVMGNN